MRRRKSFAFTLVELLIVVIIIGILAAIALPQFSDSAATAKISALDANLATARNAIELYFVQHNSVYAGVIKQHKAGVAAAADHASVEDAFIKQLTMFSDVSGNTADTLDKATYPFGPYLKKGIPANPLPATNAIAHETEVAVAVVNGPLTADADPVKGWKYSSSTGVFIANNATYQSR